MESKYLQTTIHILTFYNVYSYWILEFYVYYVCIAKRAKMLKM